MKSWRYSALAVAVMAAGPALGQSVADYPNRPIRVVVAQPPGGTTDAVARLFGQQMGAALGQQFVIDNRAGGGVAGVATQSLVANANADGYTVLAVVPNFTFTPALMKNMPVTPSDFAPVTLLSMDPYLLSATPSLPARSVKEFIALARAKPGTLNMGSGNIGAGTHLVTMYFLSAGGIRDFVTYVPYKGSGPALIDLMAGRLQASVTSIVSGGPHVRGGKLRALGVTSLQRSASAPDIPTIAEQGLPGFQATAWYGLVVPARTPVAIINKLAAASGAAARSPEIRDRLAKMGGEAVGSNPAEFRKLIDAEVPRWRNLIKEINLKVE